MAVHQLSCDNHKAITHFCAEGIDGRAWAQQPLPRSGHYVQGALPDQTGIKHLKGMHNIHLNHPDSGADGPQTGAYSTAQRKEEAAASMPVLGAHAALGIPCVNMSWRQCTSKMSCICVLACALVA